MKTPNLLPNSTKDSATLQPRKVNSYLLFTLNLIFSELKFNCSQRYVIYSLIAISNGELEFETYYKTIAKQFYSHEILHNEKKELEKKKKSKNPKKISPPSTREVKRKLASLDHKSDLIGKKIIEFGHKKETNDGKAPPLVIKLNIVNWAHKILRECLLEKDFFKKPYKVIEAKTLNAIPVILKNAKPKIKSKAEETRQRINTLQKDGKDSVKVHSAVIDNFDSIEDISELEALYVEFQAMQTFYETVSKSIAERIETLKRKMDSKKGGLINNKISERNTSVGGDDLYSYSDEEIIASLESCLPESKTLNSSSKEKVVIEEPLQETKNLPFFEEENVAPITPFSTLPGGGKFAPPLDALENDINADINVGYKKRAENAKGQISAFCDMGFTEFKVVMVHKKDPKDKKGKCVGKKIYTELELVQELDHIFKRSDIQKLDVYLTPIPKNEQTIQHIMLDDVPLESLKKIEPHCFLIERTSKKSYHAWISFEMENGERESMRARLIEALGTDKNCHSFNTRLAGTKNWKHRNLPQVPIVLSYHDTLKEVANEENLVDNGIICSSEEWLQKSNEGRSYSQISATTLSCASPKINGQDRKTYSGRKFPSYEMELQFAPFSNDPERAERGEKDRSSADFRWCLRSLSWGYSVSEVENELPRVSERARDRKDSYVSDTVKNAYAVWLKKEGIDG